MGETKIEWLSLWIDRHNGEYRPYENGDRLNVFWLDPDGHVYGGPTNWPPKSDEPRIAMVRIGKSREGDGHG